jgi:hypothetical protein
MNELMQTIDRRRDWDATMDYDDESELTDYIWRHFGCLMSDFEVRVGRAHFAEQKAASGAHVIASLILKRHSLVGDPDVEAALADGTEAFRRRVCRRLQAERWSDLSINRCPACHRVVRTPKARQCLWCGHDCHEV